MKDDLNPATNEKQSPTIGEDMVNPFDVIMGAVSDEKKKADVQQAIMLIREESYSGPIPSPRALQEYEGILPGSADRILKMAESQQEHRMQMENKAISEQLSLNKRGQILGFVIFLIGIGVAILFAYWDMKNFAGIFLTVTMGTLISIFVLGKRDSKKDLEEKSKDQTK